MLNQLIQRERKGNSGTAVNTRANKRRQECICKAERRVTNQLERRLWTGLDATRAILLATLCF